MDLKETLHKALLEVKKSNKEESAGICHHLYYYFEGFSFKEDQQILLYLDNLIFTWTRKKEIYPEDPDYPIEGSYMAFFRNENKWDKNTHFGKLRWELLEWLIEQTY